MKLGTEREGLSAVPRELIAQGDTALALGDYGGEDRATGEELSAPFAHVRTLRGSRGVAVVRTSSHPW